jgi:integrase
LDARSSRLKSFIVDGRRRGKGRRYYFRNLTDAKVKADQLAIELENFGTAIMGFTARDLVMAKEGTVELRPWGKTIDDAIKYYVGFLKLQAEQCKSPLVRECVTQFIVSRQREVERNELAARSFTELRLCVNQMVVVLGDLHIVEFDAERVRTYVDSFPLAPRTRNNIRLRLSTFFSFCISKKWITTNPCAEVEIKVDNNDVVVLGVDEVEKILRAAEASKHRAILVPYISICLFAGLRPFECRQLDWSDVDFETNHIFVRAKTSKKRESRYAQIEPTLVTWLTPYAKTSGPICGVNFRRQWESLIAKAGYSPDRPWPQDSLRHSYASYWLALHQNRAQLAELMGNSVEVIRKFYRQPISKPRCAAFWALGPRTAPNGASETGDGKVETGAARETHEVSVVRFGRNGVGPEQAATEVQTSR